MCFFDYQVAFSTETGEEDGYDAGAIRIEFFTKCLGLFDKRLFSGEMYERLPKRADSPHYQLLGLCIVHSLLNQGPGFNIKQQWAVDYLFGVEDKDLLLSQVFTAPVPVDAATAALKSFLVSLEGVGVLQIDCN